MYLLMAALVTLNAPDWASQQSLNIYMHLAAISCMRKAML